ncbi:MAG: hypothetical protein ACRDX8_00470 [Acidimicrobiales bacterium]
MAWRTAPRPRRVVVLADVEASLVACRGVGAADRSGCLATELSQRRYQVQLGPVEPPEEEAGAVEVVAAAEEGTLEQS